MRVGWVALLVGSRIDCQHSHTDLEKVTDAGLKAFSAALGSSSTITTVTLMGKSELLSCSYERSHVLLCMRVCSVCVCVCVCVRCVCDVCMYACIYICLHVRAD